MPTRPLEPQELADLLAAVHAGRSFVASGGRFSPTFSVRDGAWWVEEQDEGHSEARASSEADLREAIANHPENALSFVFGIHVRRFGAAYFAKAPASDHLAAARRTGIEPKQLGLYEALISPEPDLPAVIQAMRDGTAFKCLRALFDGKPTRGAGHVYLDTLLAMVGDIAGIKDLRRDIEALPP
jgi:hypothetical protein